MALLKICSAWDKVKPKVDFNKLRKEFDEQNESEIWFWLWSSAEVDFESLSIATGISIKDVQILVNQLVFNRLIYPDGTISKFISGVIRTEIKNRYLKNQEKKKEKEE